jgi:hypothetical protein
MAFSVRNATVERKARDFAAAHHTTLTGGLELALDTASRIKKREREAEYEAFMAKIRVIQDRVRDLPDTGLTEDEIMGWDENGLPT